MIDINTNYENFDFSSDLKNLQNSVFNQDLNKLKQISSSQNLDESQKQYLQNHLGKFLNIFLQKAKSDPNSYSWSSWQIIKDFNLQNFENPELKKLGQISNLDEKTRAGELSEYLKTFSDIKIFDIKNFEIQKDVFPTHFALQKKVDGKDISLFGYNSSTPSVNKFLSQKQNEFIKNFNNLLLEKNNQDIDSEKLRILMKNFGLANGEYTFFVENSIGPKPFINVVFGENIGISFGKNTIPKFEELIPLAQDLTPQTVYQTQTATTSNQIISNQNQSQTTFSQPTQQTQVTNTTQPVSNSNQNQSAQNQNNDAKPVFSTKPNTQNPNNNIQNSEQKKSDQKVNVPTETPTENKLNPQLQKDLEIIAKNSLTAIDLANLSEKDFVKTNKTKDKKSQSQPIDATKFLNEPVLESVGKDKSASTTNTLEQGVGGAMGSGSAETKKLKTDIEKKQYLEKLFDGKTTFNISNQKVIFETGSKNLGTTYLNGAKLYLKGVTLKDVDGTKLVYANVSNIVFNGNQQQEYKTNYRVNLGELNQVISNVDSWKNTEKTPYSQLEVGEYNSNKVYNQMLAIINMQQKQMEDGGLKNGENFSYLKHFDVNNLLASGDALPGYVTSVGKVAEKPEIGGGICASANLLFATAGLGANGATLNEYKFLKGADGKTSGTRVARQVSLGSGANDIFTNFNFSNHSLHYYNVTADNPLIGEGRKFDATVSNGGPDLKFVNNSGKTLYIHMKVTILDGGVIKNDPRAKGDNNLRGLYDNSTTWFNQCWIDDKAPSLDEINHNREQFKKFLDRRPWMKKPKSIGF